MLRSRYLGTVRTMYRVLADAHEVRERRDQARQPAFTKPELVATPPNQVWSWDITKLKGPAKYVYFSLYM
jgi:putative transposase